jgi:hypothetical protein
MSGGMTRDPRNALLLCVGDGARSILATSS